jgi:hypothetical protein
LTTTKPSENRKVLDCRILDCQNYDRQPLAENHHPGGTGPPQPRESRLVQAALSSPNMPKTMQLKELPLVASALAGGLLLS